MSIKETIDGLSESARKIFGADIRFAVARAQAWGHPDNCIIVTGAKHAAAAKSLARAVPGAKIEEQKGGGFMDLPAYTYTTVEWAAQEITS